MKRITLALLVFVFALTLTTPTYADYTNCDSSGFGLCATLAKQVTGYEIYFPAINDTRFFKTGYNYYVDFENTIVSSATPLEVYFYVQWWEGGALHTQIISQRSAQYVNLGTVYTLPTVHVPVSQDPWYDSSMYRFYVAFDWVDDGSFNGGDSVIIDMGT